MEDCPNFLVYALRSTNPRFLGNFLVLTILILHLKKNQMMFLIKTTKIVDPIFFLGCFSNVHSLSKPCIKRTFFKFSNFDVLEVISSHTNKKK